MSYETGFLKYLVKTPITFVGLKSMCIFGDIVMTLLNTVEKLFSGHLVEAFLEYFVYSKLPPTYISQVLLLGIAGATVAGLKWYMY